jgi:hypothetical protein
MELLLAAVIVALVAFVVSAPLRRRDPGKPAEGDAEAELADLDARRRSKYREIRDAETDRAAGKLSDDDFRRLDAELRREAIEILKRIDGARGRISHPDP